MTSEDKKIDTQIRQALDGLESPDANESTKKASIKRAVDEFKAAQSEHVVENKSIFQGIWQLLRPTDNADNNRRRAPMRFHKRLIISGFATLCIGFVLFSFFAQVIGPPELSSEIMDEFADFIDESPTVSSDGELEEIVVTGGRKSLERSMDTKRKTELYVSAISAEDIGQMPVQSVAESLQREAGVALSAPRNKNVAKLFHVSADEPLPVSPGYKDIGRDRFEEFEVNAIKLVSKEPVSTFSIDVDTAAYSFVRGQLKRGVLPQKDAVRIEEMINYFEYDYALPKSNSEPFKASVLIKDSPWAEGKKLLHIGIKGYDIAPGEKPRSNLVFLLDVSGSMNSPDKLPLVKQSMELLLSNLNPDDTVAIAVYAGAAGTVLEPTPVSERQKISAALGRLSAGGSTAGAEGIQLAYQLAEMNFKKDAVNRVILATDGDFNVGITNSRELQAFVERKRESGIFLSVLGFGQGNYHDAMMQTLAQNGNGIAAYIDTLSEAQKVLVNEATSTLFPIAKDVKIQIEFNPRVIAEYRLIGYETRMLNQEDFNNDAVDAGDIGAGHTVTALYEITPVGSDAKLIDKSRYTNKSVPSSTADKISDEYAFLKIRYKLPDSDKSDLITQPIGKAQDITLTGASRDSNLLQETDFATAVAAFGQLLLGGKYLDKFSYDDVITLAQNSKGQDEYGYRSEFVQLVRMAKSADAIDH